MKTAAATRKAAHAPVRAPSRTNVRFAITLAVQSVNWRGIRPTRAVSFSQCSARQLGLKPSDAPLPAPLFAFRRSARRPCAFSIQSNPAPVDSVKVVNRAPQRQPCPSRCGRRPIRSLRRFAAGTGGFLRLGAPRCGARARPNALRRRVRAAEYCAAVKSAVAGRVLALALRGVGFTRARRLIPHGLRGSLQAAIIQKQARFISRAAERILNYGRRVHASRSNGANAGIHFSAALLRDGPGSA